MDPISPMANTVSTPSIPIAAPNDKKENLVPLTSKLAELTEARSELVTRIQSLKQDMQSWRSNLDTEVTVYRNELLELKKSLNVEVDQLKSGFQEIRTILQQQQEDVAASLKSLGLHDSLEEFKDDGKTGIKGNNSEESQIEGDNSDNTKIAGNEGDAASSPIKADEEY